MKTFPIVRCLHCGFTSRKYGRKLKPPIQCRQCHKQLKELGKDYVWDSYGNFTFNFETREASKKKPELVIGRDRGNTLSNPEKKKTKNEFDDIFEAYGIN